MLVHILQGFAGPCRPFRGRNWAVLGEINIWALKATDTRHTTMAMSEANEGLVYAKIVELKTKWMTFFTALREDTE